MDRSVTINVMNIRKFGTIPVARLATRYRKLLNRPIFSEEIGRALVNAGLIEYVAFGDDGIPTRFRDTDLMRSIKKSDLESHVRSVLQAYFEKSRDHSDF